MHWKGLRLVADGSSKRQSTIESQTQARRSEHLPRPSPPETEPRYSEALPRSSGLDIPVEARDTARGDDAPTNKAPDHGVARSNFAGSSSGLSTDTPSLRRNRFSFMRLRHASDPQLSKSYAKAAPDAPPVPSLPRKCMIHNWRSPLQYPVKELSEMSSRQRHVSFLPTC
jgi:hypothetical protein